MKVMQTGKRERHLALVLALATCLTLQACVSRGGNNYGKHTSFYVVEGKNNLYYDPDTKVVYYMFNECTGYQGYGYMSPYYAPNGYPYLYDANNRKLVEIDQN